MKLQEALKNNKDTVENIKMQQKVASDILYMLAKNNHPEAIVAGGAPRNWDFGRVANDLDVYLSAPLLETELLEIIGVSSFKNLGRSYQYSGIKTIKKVIEANLGGMTVQFISMDINARSSRLFAECVFETFDFGICKIAWTPCETIKSPSFNHDKDNQMLTVNMTKIHKFNNPASLPKRLKKMRSYFPNFNVDIV